MAIFLKLRRERSTVKDFEDSRSVIVIILILQLATNLLLKELTWGGGRLNDPSNILT